MPRPASLPPACCLQRVQLLQSVLCQPWPGARHFDTHKKRKVGESRGQRENSGQGKVGREREREQGTDSSNLCDAWAKRLAFHITF